LIVSLAEESEVLRAYRIADGGFEEIDLEVVP
jgi:hypothetical protein